MSESNSFFENQNERLSCGRHALNNLLQQKIFVIDEERGKVNLLKLCNKLTEMVTIIYEFLYLYKFLVKDDKKEFDLFACRTDECYDIRLLQCALLYIGKKVSLISKEDLPIFLLNPILNMKIVYNLGNSHWVSFYVDYYNKKLYYYDSLRDTILTHDIPSRQHEEFINKIIANNIEETILVEDYDEPIIPNNLVATYLVDFIINFSKVDVLESDKDTIIQIITNSLNESSSDILNKPSTKPAPSNPPSKPPSNPPSKPPSNPPSKPPSKPLFKDVNEILNKISSKSNFITFKNNGKSPTLLMSILNHLQNNNEFEDYVLKDFKDFYSLQKWDNNYEYNKENENHVNTIKKIINELRLNINVLICTKEGKLPYLYDTNEWESLYNDIDEDGNYVRLKNAEDKVTIYIIFYIDKGVYELYYTNELYPNIDKKKLKYSLGEDTKLLDETTNAIINSTTLLSPEHIGVLFNNIEVEINKKK